MLKFFSATIFWVEITNFFGTFGSFINFTIYPFGFATILDTLFSSSWRFFAITEYFAFWSWAASTFFFFEFTFLNGCSVPYACCPTHDWVEAGVGGKYFFQSFYYRFRWRFDWNMSWRRKANDWIKWKIYKAYEYQQ